MYSKGAVGCKKQRQLACPAMKDNHTDSSKPDLKWSIVSEKG
jgi:hypothetical protein